MSFLSRLRNRFLTPRKTRRSGRPASSRGRPTLEILEDRTCPSSLAYSTYLGGSGNDSSRAIAVDAAGNAYVAGLTESANFPVTAGAYDTTFTGPQEGFVAKFNPSGALVWSTYLGGSGYQGIQAMALDGSGNVYLTGFTTSSDFPKTAGALEVNPNPGISPGATEAFVTKINATGTALVYSTYLDGSSNASAGEAIAVDASGNAYVTGYTNSSDFPTTVGAFQTTLQGSSCPFVTELNPTGSGLVYSTYLGGSSGFTQVGFGIAVNSSGDAYVTGNTDATNFPTTAGAFQTSNGTGGGFEAWNAFVTELNPAGSGLVYSTYLGGSAPTQGAGIVVDGSGNAYVAGSTASPNFPTTPGAFQTTLAGGHNAFVTKLNPGGTALVYSTYLGGSGDTFVGNGGNSIALDASGNVYVTGMTTSTNFPTADPVQAANGGGYDAFVTELNASGTGLSFSTYLGGSGDESQFNGSVGEESIALGASNIYVDGPTSSTNFPTANAFQAANAANAGGYNAFVAKITADTTPPVTTASLSGTLGGNGRYTTAVSVTLSATDPDDASATLTTYYTIDGGAVQTYAGPFTVSGNGSHTVTYYSSDPAGNVETSHSVSFTIDTTAPVTTASLSGTAGSNGWYVSAVSVTLAAADPDDATSTLTTSYAVDGGPSQTYTGPFTVSGDGIHQVTYFSQDPAGNVEASHSQTIMIDTTPPVITAAVVSKHSDDDEGRTVQVKGTMSDNLSGIDPATAAFTVVDAAGNLETSGALTINPDGTFSFKVKLEEGHKGHDKDDQHFVVTISVRDLAGNLTIKKLTVVVHDDDGSDSERGKD